MRRALQFIWLLPRNACVLILRGYRAGISPLYGDVCRYYPTCSAYAMQAIQHYGVVRGVWMGSKRIARCHPWAEGGVDDVPVREHEHVAITNFGFVVSPGHGKG